MGERKKEEEEEKQGLEAAGLLGYRRLKKIISDIKRDCVRQFKGGVNMKFLMCFDENFL